MKKCPLPSLLSRLWRDLGPQANFQEREGEQHTDMDMAGGVIMNAL